MAAAGHPVWSPAPASVAGVDRPWDVELAAHTGREVARLRRAAGLSAQALSETTTALGYPLSRSLIADLEVGVSDGLCKQWV